MAFEGNQNTQGRRDNAQTGAGGDLFDTLKNYGGGAVAASNGGEYYIKFRDKAQEVVASLLNDRFGFKLIGLNKNLPENDALIYSAMILAIFDKSKPSLVAGYSMILAGTGPKMESEKRVIRNMQVVVNHVASDCLDSVLVAAIKEAMSANFPDAEHLIAGNEAIPASIVPDSDMVEGIIRNAATACATLIQEANNSLPPLNLATQGQNTVTVIDILTGSDPVYDTTGLPQRASVVITQNLQRKSQQARDPDIRNAGQDTIRVSDVVGFINPLYAPLNHQNNQWGYQQAPQGNVQHGKLVAEFVVTGVATSRGNSASGIMYALQSIFGVIDDNNWVQPLIQQANRRDQEKSFTDISALNLVCNVGNEPTPFGTPIEPSTYVGDIALTSKLVMGYFRQGMLLSIDTPESGAQSWYLNLFAAAAQGDVGSQQRILGALDELFDGRFTREFLPRNTPIFIAQNRVPLGSYYSKNVKQDIRDVDLTAVCNASRGNPENINEWHKTFVNGDRDQAVLSMSQREGIIKHILREQCEISAYALRSTFNPEFIVAWSNAIKALNLPVTVNTPMNASAMNTGFVVPDYITQAVIHPTSTFFGGAFGNASRLQTGTGSNRHFRTGY